MDHGSRKGFTLVSKGLHVVIFLTWFCRLGFIFEDIVTYDICNPILIFDKHFFP
jgi:hypothetical protein